MNLHFKSCSLKDVASIVEVRMLSECDWTDPMLDFWYNYAQMDINIGPVDFLNELLSNGFMNFHAFDSPSLGWYHNSWLYKLVFTLGFGVRAQNMLENNNLTADGNMYEPNYMIQTAPLLISIGFGTDYGSPIIPSGHLFGPRALTRQINYLCNI